MRRVIRFLEASLGAFVTSVLWIWETGLIQATLRELLVTLNRAIRWYVQYAPRTVPGTLGALLALWLGRAFDTTMTRALMDFAGIPMVVYYGILIAFGALLGAGVIEIRRPYDDR